MPQLTPGKADGVETNRRASDTGRVLSLALFLGLQLRKECEKSLQLSAPKSYVRYNEPIMRVPPDGSVRTGHRGRGIPVRCCILPVCTASAYVLGSYGLQRLSCEARRQDSR